MENTEKKSKPVKTKVLPNGKVVSANLGGARPGSGRPKGSQEKVSIKNLLDELHVQSGGKHYEQILIEDFLDARSRKDTMLMMKYHQLILQKVLVHHSRIEIVESADVVEAKKQAFAEALAKMVAHEQE